MNSISLTVAGWVGGEVTLHQAGEHQVAHFRVASRSRRLRDGAWSEGETTWFQVKAWRALAEHVASSLKVGDPVLVQGRFVAESYERDDGVRVTRQVLVATSVGHDLRHGTSHFERTSREEPENSEAA